MNKRIIGFDLARAYAIFGMFIVNFNTVFGSHTDHTGWSGLLNLFNGNSSTLFVMLAGMGVSLMSNRGDYTAAERKKLRGIILRRSWFLFVLGVLFCLWWPADILHFYGGYMHLAVWFLFFPKKYLLYAALAAVMVFHVLLVIIPYSAGWDFETLMYRDFWTLPGFLRNTFYNGWNAIFPWVAFFFLGMYLGRLDWKNRQTPVRVLCTGVVVYLVTVLLQSFAGSITTDKDLLMYLTADYLPPFIPFMLGTASFGMILMSIFIFIGARVEGSAWAHLLASTGQMTLTHYIAHLVIGLMALSVWTGKTLSYDLLKSAPTPPLTILSFALAYFLLSCAFSYFWAKKYKQGPLEMWMRTLTSASQTASDKGGQDQ